jgi:hypothetical protein
MKFHRGIITAFRNCIDPSQLIMSNQQTVQTKGIYHGLPVFPPAVNGLTAIITGANGISGNYMLRVLAESPERWTKIYCLSRRPPAIPDGLPTHAEHIALDFLQKPEDIAKTLKEKGVKADYVFFYSYIQAKPKEGGGLWSDAEEMCRVNSRCFFQKSTPAASTNPKLLADFSQLHCFGISARPFLLPLSYPSVSCCKQVRRTTVCTLALLLYPKKRLLRA